MMRKMWGIVYDFSVARLEKKDWIEYSQKKIRAIPLFLSSSFLLVLPCFEWHVVISLDAECWLFQVSYIRDHIVLQTMAV